jgi:molecular chaperone GrpE
MGGRKVLQSRLWQSEKTYDEAKETPKEEAEQTDDLQQKLKLATDQIDKFKSEQDNFRKEKDDLKQKLRDAVEVIDRLKADMERTRKIAKQDVEKEKLYALTKFAGDLLEVTDNFDRALDNVPADCREQTSSAYNFIQGVAQTRAAMRQVLKRHAMELIPVELGITEFDPNFHEALTAIPKENENQKSGTIAKVTSDGWTINKRVLRPTKVLVTQ